MGLERTVEVYGKDVRVECGNPAGGARQAGRPGVELADGPGVIFTMTMALMSVRALGVLRSCPACLLLRRRGRRESLEMIQACAVATGMPCARRSWQPARPRTPRRWQSRRTRWAPTTARWQRAASSSSGGWLRSGARSARRSCFNGPTIASPVTVRCARRSTTGRSGSEAAYQGGPDARRRVEAMQSSHCFPWQVCASDGWLPV
mmetsp:Transcript_51073/g.158200  ORF Transcript_51073/g.158200 Transcript_51073/m.158200 type:complete len:205 (+) Transcript_51073:559-1173(+)